MAAEPGLTAGSCLAGAPLSRGIQPPRVPPSFLSEAALVLTVPIARQHQPCRTEQILGEMDGIAKTTSRGDFFRADFIERAGHQHPLGDTHPRGRKNGTKRLTKAGESLVKTLRFNARCCRYIIRGEHDLGAALGNAILDATAKRACSRRWVFGFTAHVEGCNCKQGPYLFSEHVCRDRRVSCKFWRQLRHERREASSPTRPEWNSATHHGIRCVQPSTYPFLGQIESDEGIEPHIERVRSARVDKHCVARKKSRALRVCHGARGGKIQHQVIPV